MRPTASCRSPATAASLILVRGAQACDGTQIVELLGPAAASLIGTVRRLREMRGWGPELGA